MVDRELLELAARAAGIEIEWGIVELVGETVRELAPASEAYRRDKYGIRWRWNPRDDDGDALRLAVKLDIQHFRRGTYICAQGYWRDDIISDVAKVAEDIGGDACAATRHAIVRVAAELGRNTAQGDGGRV